MRNNRENSRAKVKMCGYKRVIGETIWKRDRSDVVKLLSFLDLEPLTAVKFKLRLVESVILDPESYSSSRVISCAVGKRYRGCEWLEMFLPLGVVFRRADVSFHSSININKTT